VHLAAERGFVDVVHELTRGPYGNMKCAESATWAGNVALHLACNNGHSVCAMQLLDTMKQLKVVTLGEVAFDAIRNNFSQTPVDIAIEKEHTQLAAAMKRATAAPAEVAHLYLREAGSAGHTPPLPAGRRARPKF
jgi:ankyrin repeat protein